MKLFALAAAGVLALGAPAIADDMIVEGDLTLTEDYCGSITIRNGTLTLQGARVRGNIDQQGPGSVILSHGSIVFGNIAEGDVGGVKLECGIVFGNILELREGTVTIERGSMVWGNVVERYVGSILNHGLIVGNMYEYGGGYAVVSGRVTGNVEEAWEGDVRIEASGKVHGNVTETGPGTIYLFGRVSGEIQED